MVIVFSVGKLGFEGGYFMYEKGMSCINCSNCKTRETTDGKGENPHEVNYCIIDGCEVDDTMLCGSYQ